MKLLLRIAYFGTAYHGFQVQPNQITVQEVLQNAVEATYGTRFPLTGCSRTDSGVHAEEFYCAVDSGDKTDSIPLQSIPKALNFRLPNDISVLDAYTVPDSFHPRYDVISKTYEYRIWNNRIGNPFLYDRTWQVPQKLNIEKMNLAANAILGSHDFTAFMAQGSLPKGTTVRTVTECNVLRGNDSIVTLRITADGFLYNMVRIIAGTLVAVSSGRIKPEDMLHIIEARNRSNAGPTAPAQGLYLCHVTYPESVFDFDSYKMGVKI